MKISAIVTLLLVLLTSATAFADLVSVELPATTEMNTPVIFSVTGYMVDSCWEYLGLDVSQEDMTATVTIYTQADPPPGVVCLPVLVDYEVFPTITLDTPGEWTVRVVEHAMYVPGGDIIMDEWEGTITVTGEVPVQPVTWSAIRAQYR